MLTINFDLLQLEPGNRVLDLGCGAGRHIRGTRLRRGVHAVALDLGAEEVRTTAESLRSMDGPDANGCGSVAGAGKWLALQGDSYRLPFAAASFDCVIASEVLEHLHDDDAALAEITRVLKPDGTLAVSVPRFGPEAVCWALSPAYRRSPGGHVRIYRRLQLRRKLGAHGYRIFAGHHAHGLHSPYWWLKCFVGMENERSRLVRRYHDLLVRDLFEKPRVTRLLDRALTPAVGKSIVLYATKSRERS